MKILVVNVGSTSLKFRLFDMADETVLAEGKIERVGGDRSPMSFRVRGSTAYVGEVQCRNQREAIRSALSLLTEAGTGVLSDVAELGAVGFKPVHAKAITDTVLVTEDVIAAMEEYVFLAPVHNPPYIEAFRIFRDLAPTLPLIGVFEPAFHRTIPDYARTYGIPWQWSQRYAIQRYGFHGASHSYVALHVPDVVGRPADDLRIISCHLGGSSSVCAIRQGESIDTSMGFSPQSGLPNATRNGDLDPFIALYLMEKEALSPRQVCEILVTDGGLRGISGLSGDVRDLEEEAARGNVRAGLALKVLAYDTQKYIGAYFVALGGLDVLAFTGGIGENSASVRESICRGLGCLGVELDWAGNQSQGSERVISASGSPVTVVVVAANEELVIARETVKLLAAQEASSPPGGGHGARPESRRTRARAGSQE